MIEMTEVNKIPNPVIKIFGVGGGGCNAVNYMVDEGMQGVEFCSANTDSQSLAQSKSGNTIQLGETLLGAGSDPEKGKLAAEEKIEEIKKQIQDADLLFITAGMGGGTGTGASPVIAQVAKDMGVLTVAVVTMPFTGEFGREEIAIEGVAKLAEQVNCVITIPNDKLIEFFGKSAPFFDSFRDANKVLYQAVEGIVSMMSACGEMNVDFEDLNNVMKHSGFALMSSATATGDGYAEKAVQNALNNPLLDHLDLQNVAGVLANVTSGDNFKMEDYSKISEKLKSIMSPEAKIKVGVVKDSSIEDGVTIGIIATGLREKSETNQAQQIEISHQEEPVGSTTIAPIDDVANNSLSSMDRMRQFSKNNALRYKTKTGTEDKYDDEATEEYLNTPAFLRRQAD